VHVRLCCRQLAVSRELLNRARGCPERIPLAPLGAAGFAQLAYEKRAVVLVAAGSEQDTFQYAPIRSTVLARALTEGLVDGLADLAPRDRRISVGEWVAFAEKRVPNLVREIYSGRLFTAQGKRPPARPDPAPRAYVYSVTTPAIAIGRITSPTAPR